MSLYYRPFTGNKEVYEYDVIITIHLAAKIRKKQQKKEHYRNWRKRSQEKSNFHKKRNLEKKQKREMKRDGEKLEVKDELMFK